MVHRRELQIRSLVIVLLVVAASACSSMSSEGAATERQLAEQLVVATQSANVAPRLTVDLAESLYGTDARSVCAAFEGGTSTSADLILRGNTAQGRRKAITDAAVTYAGLVVRTYCPDVLADYAAVVRDVDPFGTDG